MSQLIAHVLMPLLLPDTRKLDYVPVLQCLRTRKCRSAAKTKAQVGTLQDDEEEDKSKLPTPLYQGLAKAFTYNSANANIVASVLAPGPAVASGSTCRLWKEARAETLSDIGSQEVVIAPPTKRTCTHARPQAASNLDHNCLSVLLRVSPRRKKGHLHTPTRSHQKRQRVSWAAMRQTSASRMPLTTRWRPLSMCRGAYRSPSYSPSLSISRTILSISITHQLCPLYPRLFLCTSPHPPCCQSSSPHQPLPPIATHSLTSR